MFSYYRTLYDVLDDIKKVLEAKGQKSELVTSLLIETDIIVARQDANNEDNKKAKEIFADIVELKRQRTKAKASLARYEAKLEAAAAEEKKTKSKVKSKVAKSSKAKSKPSKSEPKKKTDKKEVAK